MRISDWSSDVCSSDLGDVESQPDKRARRDGCEPGGDQQRAAPAHGRREERMRERDGGRPDDYRDEQPETALALHQPRDRKSVVSGTSVSVRVDLGGRRIIKKKITHQDERRTTK